MAYTWDNRVSFAVQYLYVWMRAGDSGQPPPDSRSQASAASQASPLLNRHNRYHHRYHHRYHQRYHHEVTMAYSWENRVAFVVRFLYDIDNNGQLDKHDFACLALRTCVLEGKGDCSPARLQKFQHIMISLWEEISRLADFDKDGTITTDEFKRAVQETCVGKKYDEFPQAMKAFIEINFKLLDINEDGVMGVEEFRFDCVSRMVVEDIKEIDAAYESLLNDDDRKIGGITLARYKELFAQFLSDQSDNCPAKLLFGPLEI